MCDPGYYCTPGSEDAQSCPKGKYCDRSMLEIAGTDCLAGYYCDEVQIENPSPEGKTCPRGQYCPTGSVNPIDCSEGTYNNKLGASEEADCLP